MRGREVVLLAKFLHRVEVHLAEDFADGTLLQRIGQVGGHFGDPFHIAQTLIEEVLGLHVTWRVFSSFLVGNKTSIADGFGLDFLAVHQVAQLVQEQVEGTTIENQVMHIRQEADILLSGDDFHTVQRSLSQVERPYKFYLVFLKFLFA